MYIYSDGTKTELRYITIFENNKYINTILCECIIK